MIKTGRYGTVKYDPAGITPVALIALNKWKLSQKTEYTDVTCFGDANKVYVPGMKDVSGSFEGFWDSTNVVIFDAVDAATPGKLELAPNSTEPTFKWSGLAYIDADIDCDTKVPKVSGSFMGAGPWVMAP
jgi:hypothetical protein